MFKEIILLTWIFETVTIFCRFVFGDGRKFWKLIDVEKRVHHLYVGLFLVITALVFLNDFLLLLGSSLFFSDFLHHFVILPLWVRDTRFP